MLRTLKNHRKVINAAKAMAAANAPIVAHKNKDSTVRKMTKVSALRQASNTDKLSEIKQRYYTGRQFAIN